MQRNRRNKVYALAGIVVSFAGTIVALLLTRRWGIGWLEIGLLCLMYVPTMVGVTVGNHRFFSHHAFEASPGVCAALGICAGMAAHGPCIYWAANHRVHHRFTDAPGDPHSPHFRGAQPLGRLSGFWHAHMGWLYRHEVPDAVTYARDLLRSPLIRRLDQMYLVWVALGLAFPALLGGLITGTAVGAIKGLLWGGFVRIFVVYQVALAVGSFCHTSGRRPFAIRGRSANLGLLAIQSFGEAWHQNHHAFPASATFSFEWWQVDLGAVVIRALEALGWVWNVKKPSPEQVAARRAAPDDEDWTRALAERAARTAPIGGAQPPL